MKKDGGKKAPQGVLKKLRLVLAHEREITSLKASYRSLQGSLEQLSVLMGILSTLSHEQEARLALCSAMIHHFPYEAAALFDGEQVIFQGPKWAERDCLRARQLASDGAACLHSELAAADEGHQLDWMMGGPVPLSEGRDLFLLVGRTPRTVGYYPKPWTQEQDFFAYLLRMLTHAFSGVVLRAGLQRQRDSLQIQVGEATAQLREALQEAERAQTEAVEASEAKSAFLANMSHELRTPLNAIIGYTELIQEEAQDLGEQVAVSLRPDLEKISSSSQYLLSLVSNILDLSKIEAGMMDVAYEYFDIAHAVSDIWGAAQMLARKHRNQLALHMPAESIVACSDLTKLRQILLNLIGNAAKFTQAGSIALTVELLPGREGVARQLRFCVSDTGIGMTQEQQERIFTPFSQGSSDTMRKFGGTGLGLAICRSFSELLGGSLEVESVYGEGSSFTLTLPLLPQGSP